MPAFVQPINEAVVKEQPAEPIDLQPFVINPATETAADPEMEGAVALILDMVLNLVICK